MVTLDEALPSAAPRSKNRISMAAGGERQVTRARGNADNTMMRNGSSNAERKSRTIDAYSRC
ncbi:hypothetical protein ANCCAN_17216 [Ancylostoma caninum]|uniref:Uncharacterized protein n=1 Tax=Ancylostoma caninum TaxID=29170 RepID=A0A368G1J0_ANCCA|nr:hypothetical protein ANCCAN_17216 [Ancylostoma caninum]